MAAENERSDSLHRALAGLIDEGTLSAGQAQRVDEVLRARAIRPDAPDGDENVPERRERIVEVLSYLGGALVIGALILIVSLAWDDLAKVAKLAICGGATVLLLAAATAVARIGTTTGHRRRRALAPTLGALGAAGAALTVGVGIGVDAFRGLIVPGVVMAVVAGVGYLAWRGAPLVCALFGGGLLAVVGVLDSLPASWRIPVVIGAVVVGYGAVWLGIGHLRLVEERHVAGVIGGTSCAVGAELASIDNDFAAIGLVLGILVIAGMFTLFWTTRKWWYAVLGAATALVVPPTALGVIWGNALVVGVVLLVVGVALIVGAVLTVRRRPATAEARSPNA